MWLLISDTHDNMDKIKKIPDLIKNYSITKVFHCGDMVSPFTVKYFLNSGTEFYGIFGNNDGEKIGLNKVSGNLIGYGPRAVETDGKKIFMMHEPYSLIAAENSGVYDYVFFGHTHEKVNRKNNNTFVINPGEGCGWLTGKATCAVINPFTEEVKIVEI